MQPCVFIGYAKRRSALVRLADLGFVDAARKVTATTAARSAWSHDYAPIYDATTVCALDLHGMHASERA